MSKKTFNKTLIGMVARNDIQMTDIPEIKQDLNNLTALSNELIGKDTAEMEIDRMRDNANRINYSENAPELYGRSRVATMAKYIPANGLHRLHSAGEFADVEMDEMSKALVSVATHGAVDVEKPL